MTLSSIANACDVATFMTLWIGFMIFLRCRYLDNQSYFLYRYCLENGYRLLFIQVYFGHRRSVWAASRFKRIYMQLHCER